MTYYSREQKAAMILLRLQEPCPLLSLLPRLRLSFLPALLLRGTVTSSSVKIKSFVLKSERLRIQPQAL